ncbi:MAG: ABC transporter ATP-binding protein [Jatrophihabitans sp.]
MTGQHAAPADDEPANIDLDIRIADPAPSPQHPITDALALSAEHIIFQRHGRTILDHASLTARPGDSVAVVGPSGSGKSSLLAILAGLERPDSGTVHRPDVRIGLILQGYGLASVLTAAENVEAPLQAGQLGPLPANEVRKRAATALQLVGLDAVADHLVEELSGGQQQRVAIARALAIDPSVLLADELTAELDHHW